MVTSESTLDATLEYPPARLLAYSINDNQRDASGELTGYFVDTSGRIAEGEEATPTLKMYATGTESVLFAANVDSDTPLFLVAREDGASFEPVPEEGSYFAIRRPLEESAARQGFISLESELFPGQFLRHQGFVLKLDPIDANSESLARRDATFLLLADGAEIPVVGDEAEGDGAEGGGEDMLAMMVSEIGTGAQVTLEQAIYTTFEQTIRELEMGRVVEVSFLLTMLTSLYEVDEAAASRGMTIVLERHGFGSATSVEVVALAEIVGFGAGGGQGGGVGGFHLAAHFAAMEAVDLGACGTEEGGFRGRRGAETPTNSHGDVHILTPDGLAYDFQDEGEFVLAASTDGLLEVQTRQTRRNERKAVSWNTAVAIRHGASVIEIYADEDGQRIYYDGEAAELPGPNNQTATTGADRQLAGGGFLQYDGEGKRGPRYLVIAPDGGFTVRVNLSRKFLDVGVSGGEGRFSGLLGNLDGNPLNDMLPRDGAELICPPADGQQLARFGDSWRVSAEETLFRSERGEGMTTVVTEAGTGRRVGAEAAVRETLEDNLTALEGSETVDVGFVATLMTATFGISEEEASKAVVEVFDIGSAGSGGGAIAFTAIEELVETQTTRAQGRSLEEVDLTVRASAQRICEAGGVTDPLALANCTLDVAATQDEAFLESSVTFQEAVATLPPDRRQAGTVYGDPLAPEAVLPPEQVIEIVGPPEVVPTFEELVTLEQTVRTGMLTVATDGALTTTVTEVGTGRNVPVEAAVFDTLEGNFAALDPGETVDLAFVITVLTTLYEIDEAVAEEALVEVFSGQGVTSVGDSVEVAQITEELTEYAQQIEVVRTRAEETQETGEQTVVTQVTSNITSTVDVGACSDVAGLQSPAELLEGVPAAGGVAIYCATHARGQTVVTELGRSLDDAVARAEESCQAEAASRVEDFGDIVITCRQIGSAEREFDFGGGVLSVGRDVQVTFTERRIEKAELLERIDNLSLVLSPVPGLAAQCTGGETIPIEGLTVTDGLLDYTGEGQSDFQNLCGDVRLRETEDDFLLQAVCFNDDASDAPPSAISLLGVDAIEALISYPGCAPEVEAEFVALAEDGLETAFPDRGDFVLIRSTGWDTFGRDGSSDPGIVVNARRDLWTGDRSASVFTALSMRVGTDTMVVRATPEPAISVNGLPFEDAVSEEGDALAMPGGGRIRMEQDAAGAEVMVISWPSSAFAVRIALYPHSHVVPAVQVDEAFEYEGLARFTSHWMLGAEEAGFALPLGGDPTCECAQADHAAGEGVEFGAEGAGAQSGFPAGGLGSGN
ncbi:VWD domain-containing protein [Jannaschia sp. W003]|uniref:VWD domain-containing protein n=1 Tax=Jannaschia sp. W003 TaxID=2867012 RepID=UPI0021A61BAA|nr:VWD domain-containing protein [Jannaschia sp. W003]UWQ23116.1 VWD domain-containing protein [Jannaschia sp. W003]